MTSTETTAQRPETTPEAPSNSYSPAASAADQRIAALRSQLAMMQAERSLLHVRASAGSVSPSARSAHGPGGWIFAGLSFVFLLSMLVFAATRPPTVRVVEVEVTREVLVQADARPLAATAPEAVVVPDEAAPESARPRPRPRGPGTSQGSPGAHTGMVPTLELDRCGSDPLCGS